MPDLFLKKVVQPMALSFRQRWSLRRIERSLHRSDPRFAALMRTLTALAVDHAHPVQPVIQRRRGGTSPGSPEAITS